MDYSVWGYLEARMSTESCKSMDSFKAALLREWNGIDVEYLRQTVSSPEKRLKACIKARGGHFEHHLK